MNLIYTNYITLTLVIMPYITNSSNPQEKDKYSDEYKKIIYTDVKNWVYSHPIFQKYYGRISNYDILSQHIDLQRSLSKRDSSNYTKLFKFLLTLTNEILTLYINNLDDNDFNNENNKKYIVFQRPWFKTKYNHWQMVTNKHIEMASSCVVTIMFDIMTEKNIIYQSRIVCKNNIEYTDALKNKLLYFKNENHVDCIMWKGSDYYYKKLFYKSIIHHNSDFDYDILKFKYITDFDTMIYGHPKASHGLAYEGWLEIQELYKNYYENMDI